MPVGEPFICEVDVTVHNNGPVSPLEVDVEDDFTAPFDCVVTESDPQIETLMLPSSESQVITFEWEVECEAESNHIFVSDAEISPTDDAVIDSNPNNNTGTDDDTTAVTIVNDVKVLGVTGDAPADAPAGVSFDVDVEVAVHNNGPAGPIKVEGGAGIAVPSDCTIDPSNYQLFNIMVVPVSVTQFVTETFSITCAEPGVHTFVVCGRAGPNTLHVVEGSTHSNFRSSPIQVEITGENGGYDATPSPTAEPTVPTTSCSILGDPPEICGNGIDDDGDTDVDEEPDTDLDGISNCEDNDDDGDGFTDVAESVIGTDPLDACSNSVLHAAWPVDMNNSRTINVTDVVAMKPAFGSSVARFDLDLSGTVGISDVLALKSVFSQTCE